MFAGPEPRYATAKASYPTCFRSSAAVSAGSVAPPLVPYFSIPGLFLAASTSSASILYGDTLGTSTITGDCATETIGVNDRMVSNFRFP